MEIGEAFSSSITCSRILVDTSVILELMVSFDKGTTSSLFLCGVPQTSLVISRAHGFTNVSPMACAFFPWQSAKQPYMIFRGKAFAS